MSAELLVLGGPRGGEAFALGERSTIGSDPSCDVRIDGAGVAPLHVLLARASQGGYKLTVIAGAADVLVEGKAHREARLYHGQKIRIGAVELQLLSAEEKNPTETNADFGAPAMDLEPAPRVERVFKTDKFAALTAEAVIAKAEDEAHGRSVLHGLYLVGHATTERSLTRILERTADAVATAIAPDRLVIVLHDGEKKRIVPAIVRRGERDEKGSKIPVSHDLIQRSIDKGLSVLTRARHAGEREGRPVACAPLTTPTERVGAIYLERLPGAPSFHDGDLDFLGAVGRIVGLSIERANLEANARIRTVERDRERSRWHAVVQALRSGVLILDAEGKVELANPAARAILAERLGVAGDVSGLTELGGIALADLVKKGEDHDAYEVVLPGAPEAVLEVRPSPVVETDGTRSGAALLVNDRTQERLREAKLLQSEKLSALGEMLAGVAHELNNPLATILGFAELLSRKAKGDERRGLDAILEEAERCRRVVQTLLAFARPRKAVRIELDLGDVAGSVVDLLAHDLKNANVTVTRDLPPLPPVRADRYELQQVFFNLVKNAREAIQGTGRPGTLTVVATAKEGRVRVEVRDSGPGLPAEARGVLVPRPFHTTKGEAGTGLGLSIAHGIVRDHGGEIVAGVAPEGGASFTVELPVSSTATPSLAAETPVPGRTGPARRVLIVDDEEHVRELLSQICRDLGHTPLVAGHGREALDVLDRSGEVSAVLSDIRMPEMDGIAFFTALRERGHRLASRFVFLSGDLARAETAAFLKTAGRPVLPKPFRFAQVCRVLEDVLASA
jgi:two-component system NtrC family sensor kinase